MLLAAGRGGLFRIECFLTGSVAELPQCLGQLIGTRGAASSAVDSFEPCDDFIDLHALDQCRNALRIAMAAADELNTLDMIPFDGHIDEFRTGAVGFIYEILFHNTIHVPAKIGKVGDGRKHRPLFPHGWSGHDGAG